MNGYLARLNPSERRFVVGVGLLFFLAVNVFWIWPHFGDWSNYKNRLAKARTKLGLYQSAINQIPSTRDKIQKLANEGTQVPPEDQSIQFLRTITMQVNQSGIGFNGNSRHVTSTNQFFVEQLQTISVVGGEQELVNFLYSLGAGNSLIRVRELSIRPADQNRQKLNASITLVASYQKNEKKSASKTPATTRPPAAKTAAPARPAPAPARITPHPAVPVKRPAPARPLPNHAAPLKKK
ncbi:MAG TPA: hypothetical protein VFM25_06525 [Verrucomicrobiae bacterium]|nr:hypothetical protein [Verrucomicrobiae bacterium]